MFIGEEWNDQYQPHQKNIFGIIEDFGDAEFSGFDFIEPVLDQSERTKPAAGGPTDQQANGNEKSQQKERQPMDGSKMLQHANRATENGKWAGVTV